MLPLARLVAATAVLALAPLAVHAKDGGVTHLPAPARPDGSTPAFSAAVMSGRTLYVSGTTDGGAAMGGTPADAAKRVLDNIKHTVEAAGMTMDDLVWVQVFSSDLKDYDAFNTVYQTYFKGPLPARAYLGADHLLGGARFEVMGIAVRPKAEGKAEKRRAKKAAH